MTKTKTSSISNVKPPFPLVDFKVFPRCVGVWEGSWIRLDQEAQVVEQFTAVLTQKIIGNQWVQTNENKYDDRIEFLDFWGQAINDNTLLLKSSESPYCNFKMLAQEYADNIIMIRVWDQKSGAPLATETINLVSENYRIRTMQQFLPPDGELYGFMIIREHRVG